MVTERWRLMPEPEPLDWRARLLVFVIWILVIGTALCWAVLLWLLASAIWNWLN